MSIMKCVIFGEGLNDDSEIERTFKKVSLKMAVNQN